MDTAGAQWRGAQRQLGAELVVEGDLGRPVLEPAHVGQLHHHADRGQGHHHEHEPHHRGQLAGPDHLAQVAGLVEDLLQPRCLLGVVLGPGHLGGRIRHRHQEHLAVEGGLC